MESLWGDEFKIEPVETKKLLDKINSPKDVKVKKALKSKKIPIETQLQLIEESVLKTLGTYKDNTLVIKSYQDFVNYIDIAINQGVIAVDTETNNSLDPITCKIMGLCIYTPSQKNAYIPVNHVDRNGVKFDWQVTEEQIQEQLSRLTNTNILMHNGKFDIQVIKCTCNVELKCYWDTLIGSRILDENERAGLKQQYISKIDPSIEKYSIDELFEGVEYSIVDPSIFALYAATDAYMTYKLYEWQLEEFSKPGNEKLFSLFRDIEMNVLPVVTDMELTGVCIDKEYAERLSKKYHKMSEEIDLRISEELKKYEGVIAKWRLTKEANYHPAKKTGVGEGKSKNEQLEDPVKVTSPTQIAILLYDVLQMPVVDKKQPRATGEDALKKMELKLCDLILEKRGIEKLISTYIDKLASCVSKKDGRLHAKFNQCGTDTGRLSCISKGTMISCPGGDKKIEDIQPGEYVYCYDSKGVLKLSKVVNAYFNGNRKCLKLKWRSKYNHSLMGELICTPDHMIKTTTGWKEAQDLVLDDSVFYVHRRINDSTVSLYGNYGQGNEEEHVWIKNNHFDKQGSQYHVHHVDSNRLNNAPENLMIVNPCCHTAVHLDSKLPSNEHYCRRYNFSYDDLISMGENVLWELTKLPYDFGSVRDWYKSYRINYILKYTETYSKRTYHESRGRVQKNLHLQLTKDNLLYALELAEGDTSLAASYFAITETNFIESCDKYELLSNHNVYSIEYLDGTYDVYDLEVEKYHNFIANELCVHNCSDPNLQNIPSGEHSIRMMFVAGDRADFIKGDNEFKVYKEDEVLTDEGYVPALNLHAHSNIVLIDEGVQCIYTLTSVRNENDYIILTC